LNIAQPKIIANIPNGENSPIISSSNNLITVHIDFEKELNFLTETNIITGAQVSFQISNEVNIYDCYFTSKGLFFIRGRYNSNSSLVDTLCFLDYSTKNVVKLRPINFRKNINDNSNNYRILGVFNDLFYCVGANKNNTFDVWRSDGTQNGTHKIWTSNSPSPQAAHVNGCFIFTSSNGLSSSIVSIADTGLISPIVLRNFDSKRFSIIFANYELNDGHFYMNISDSVTKDYECISTQGTLQTTVSRFRHPKILYRSNQSFESKINAVVADTIHVRSIQTGEIIKIVPVPDENKQSNGGMIYSMGKGLFVIQSDKYGVELGYLNRNDSFIRLDISKGPFSSLFEAGFWSGQINYTGFFDNQVSDSFYLAAFENNSNQRCLYKVILGADSAKISRLAYLPYLNKQRIDPEYPFVYKNKFYQIVRDLDANTNLLYEVVPDEDAGYIKDLHLDSTFTWHRQVGFGALLTRDPQYVLSDVGIDSEDNSLLSVNVLNNGRISNYSNNFNYTFKSFQQYDTRYAKNINALNFTFKISPMGNILWTRSFGNNTTRVSNKLKQVIDKKDHIYVTGMAFRSAIFGLDTINRQNAFLYLVKLDGKTGNILFYKILAESQLTNDLDVDVIKIDWDNNLYISFHYENYELLFANSITSNTSVSPANALAKFDESGNLLWIKNTLTPFTNYFGQTRDLCFDEENKIIYLMQSVGDYNWSSSCKFSNWDSYLQCLNLDGEIMWSKRIISDDLHSLRSIVLDKNGNINVSGYFRGTMQFDNFKLTSYKPVKNGCNQFQYVTATINPRTTETLMAMTFDNWVYLPQKNINTDIEGKNISIGFEPATSRSFTLMAKEIDHWGGIVGSNKIDKLGNPFDWDYYPSIASKNDYVVIADISYNQFDTFSNLMNNVYNISVARYKLENFFEPASYQFPINEQTSEGNKYKLIIYPNPCDNKLNVYSKISETTLEYSIYQLDGKQVFTPDYEIINNILIFDVSLLETGFYFLKVVGSNGAETYKFLKE
jgi:hypothetical protein